LDQPQTNHNGGWIGFSPRKGETNNLYIAVGDGGSANDQGIGHIEPGGNAQNTLSLFGKILRIQIDSAKGTYTSPANNPFGNEVFTYGLRNPYRVSFDRETGDMFIGDVGQGSREEIDRQLASNPNGGENYGWRLREGSIQAPGVGGSPPSRNVEPILDYDRNVGTTIIGGYVYRGSLAPDLEGKYIFGDFVAGKIFMSNPDGTGFQDATALFDPTGALRIANPSSFGEDAAGELYIVDYSQGAVFLIIPEPGIVSLLGLAALGCLVVVRRYRRRGVASEQVIAGNATPLNKGLKATALWTLN
jgi:glucose/arabinose dehydrogenase